MVLTFHNEGYFNVVVSMILETWTEGWLNAVGVGVVLVTVVAMLVDDDDVVVDGAGGDGVVDAVDEVPVLVAVVVGVPLLQKQVN